MRRAGFLLIVLTACGGSDSTVIDGGEDATNGGDGSTTNDGATTDGTTTNDATTNDAGTDAITTTDGATNDSGDGGTSTSTPNKVVCGNVVCNTGQGCCSTPNTDGGFTLTCVSNNNCPNGALRVCDEAADCPAQEVCCYEVQGNNLSAGCHGDCGGGGGTRFQACSSTAECLSGTCAVHNCDAGGSVETCKGIPNICP